MGNKNNIIKGCDMVLSLSETMINHQFENLWKQSLKAQKPVDIDEKKVKVYMKDMKDEKIKEGDKIIMNKTMIVISTETKDEWGDVYINTIEACISSPKIEILEQGKCLFSISFQESIPFKEKGVLIKKKGVFQIQKGDKSISTEFDKISFTFEVPIGSHSISDKYKKEDLDYLVTEESKKQISDFLKKVDKDGLSQSDFSIQQILMDFSNVNIEGFRPSSKLPENLEISRLKIMELIHIYFSKIQKSKTPYVIGYGITLNEKKDTSLFHPTGRQYSTSYDEDSNYSTVNFLMMAFGNPFPDRDDLSILAKSLLRSVPVANVKDLPQGVFGIDYELFRDKFIKDGIMNACVSGLNSFIASVEEKSGNNEDERGWFSFKPSRSYEFKPFDGNLKIEKVDGNNIYFDSIGLQLSSYTYTSGGSMSMGSHKRISLYSMFSPQVTIGMDDSGKLKIKFIMNQFNIYRAYGNDGRVFDSKGYRFVESTNKRYNGIPSKITICVELNNEGKMTLTSTSDTNSKFVQVKGYKKSSFESDFSNANALLEQMNNWGVGKIDEGNDYFDLDEYNDDENRWKESFNLDWFKETKDIFSEEKLLNSCLSSLESLSVMQQMILPLGDIYIFKNFRNSTKTENIGDGDLLCSDVTYINNWNK